MTTAAAPAPQDFTDFRARRDAGLADPHGILSQVALHWTDPADGAHTLEGVPGTWKREGDVLEGVWEDGELELLADAPEVLVEQRDGTTRVTVGAAGDVRLARFGNDVQFDVIRRGDRIGLRVLDPSAPRLAAFDGVPTYDYDPQLVLRGTFTPRPEEVTVGSALPWLEQRLPSPGVATFEVDGREVELVVTGRATLSFTDETSGGDSADWRAAEGVIDGHRMEVDLNRAVNFPSAFSAWGTCPRPPAGNHLPVEVRAGERKVERTER
ncbi:DUF1684 domain-containing protein [Brachybacterium aquaticum]|uniref:Uncharacterized protein (DUF1684 family) n=1 Tax=Brachybacterium aquaticum TaxID=1432564 RepID=A0A841AEI0_9MICO|nr:DUF1684 domain-containing protein [Brachybacterium aquaticum]MBB5832373.1 uncharacterized protein (DUF1684 family) [Brachybacterium aquaticum]